MLLSEEYQNIFKPSSILVRNDLRSFEQLKDSDLPSILKQYGNSVVSASSPLQCAQACKSKKEWCRSFTYSPSYCQLFKGSFLISETAPLDYKGVDLYTLSKFYLFHLIYRVDYKTFVTVYMLQIINSCLLKKS